MRRVLILWCDWASAHPAPYLSGCLLIGLALRWLLAGGDWQLLIDPRFPLLLRHH